MHTALVITTDLGRRAIRVVARSRRQTPEKAGESDMDNVTIKVTDRGTIVVRADTKRFGKDAIMFEGNTFMQAFDYVRQTSGKNHFQLQGIPLAYGWFTDRDGRTMPAKLNVIFN